MANIRKYNMNGTLILGIDYGYGNIKTAHRVFPTALIKSGKAPTFSKGCLEYDGYFYIIGEGHKSFIAEKQPDDDNYILTFAAIAKELNARELTCCKSASCSRTSVEVGAGVERSLPPVSAAE